MNIDIGTRKMLLLCHPIRFVRNPLHRCQIKIFWTGIIAREIAEGMINQPASARYRLYSYDQTHACVDSVADYPLPRGPSPPHQLDDIAQQESDQDERTGQEIGQVVNIDNDACR